MVEFHVGELTKPRSYIDNYDPLIPISNFVTSLLGSQRDFYLLAGTYDQFLVVNGRSNHTSNIDVN